MSLILEALRKSEAERRRAQAPDLRVELAPVPAQRRVVIPAWAWLLLPASAVLLTAWLLRTPDQASPPVVPADAGMATREATPALPAVPRLSPPDVVAAPKPAPVVAQAPEVAPPPSPAVTQPAAVATNPVPMPVQPMPPPVATADTGDSDILQLSDLSATERKSLPPLKVSMHLWDADPARRFVIVDGNRLVEGDRIGDAVVTTITTDGVLLDWNGRRLKLPIR